MQSDLLVWIAPMALEIRQPGWAARAAAAFGEYLTLCSVIQVSSWREKQASPPRCMRAHQCHFDALLRRLAVCPVAELRGIGIALEVAVKPLQQVPGEGGGHGDGIDVGGLH